MKKSAKYIIASLFVILSINISNAQNTNTLYFMNEIAERNNLNPAFTPSCNFYFDFVFLPNTYFSFGNDNFILRDFIYNQNGKTQSFLNSEESLEHFFNNLQPTTTINLNYNLNILENIDKFPIDTDPCLKEYYEKIVEQFTQRGVAVETSDFCRIKKG